MADQIGVKLEAAIGALHAHNKMHEEAAIARARELEQARGFKYMGIPELLIATGAASFSMGPETGINVGPEQGWIWHLRRVVVTGLTTGATPDVVNLYFDAKARPAEWQFNGNNFAYTFGRGELRMKPGQTMGLTAVGTFASTSQIRLTGSLEEIPAEMEYRLR